MKKIIVQIFFIVTEWSTFYDCMFTWFEFEESHSSFEYEESHSSFKYEESHSSRASRQHFSLSWFTFHNARSCLFHFVFSIFFIFSFFIFFIFFLFHISFFFHFVFIFISSFSQFSRWQHQKYAYFDSFKQHLSLMIFFQDQENEKDFENERQENDQRFEFSCQVFSKWAQNCRIFRIYHCKRFSKVAISFFIVVLIFDFKWALQSQKF
jgi:hypothetical protein